MSSIAIVSDSTASLPEAFIQQHNIRVVPLYIKIGDETYRDTVDITAEQFYERLPHTTPLPTTSQPSVGDFLTTYRDLAERGASTIISVHLSSGISGTINSATQAAKQVSVPVEIVDTQSAAASHRLTVEAGAKALEAGAGVQDVLRVMRQVIERQRTLFIVDTLEYLYKGGRIGGAAALIGSVLQFKPLLYFKDGKIDALERVRKSSRALNRLVEVMADWLGREEPLRTIVMHAAALERAETLATLLRQQLNVVDLEITSVTPVIGAHAGNGTLGVCCCPVSAFER